MMKRLVYPLDLHGFVIWESEFFRFENENYVLQKNEVDTPIPIDTVWIQPRWNGGEWVEGKDHPEFPVHMEGVRQ